MSPIRASCSYPGLFQPVKLGDLLLVDGAMSMEVPALVARKLGATRVISVHLPMQGQAAPPTNMFQVVNRCFQIMQRRMEDGWRRMSDVIMVPDVAAVEWDGFASALDLIAAGEKAAEAALPQIRAWIEAEEAGAGRGTASVSISPSACARERAGVSSGERASLVAEEVLNKLRALGNPANVAGMARFGIVSAKALGVPTPELRALAKRIGRNQRWPKNCGRPESWKRAVSPA